MMCLACGAHITSANRQTYVGGLQLPYCKHCTDAFNAKKKLETMVPKEKKKARRMALRKLLKMGIKKEEAEEQIKKAGL